MRIQISLKRWYNVCKAQPTSLWQAQSWTQNQGFSTQVFSGAYAELVSFEFLVRGRPNKSAACSPTCLPLHKLPHDIDLYSSTTRRPHCNYSQLSSLNVVLDLAAEGQVASHRVQIGPDKAPPSCFRSSNNTTSANNLLFMPFQQLLSPIFCGDSAIAACWWQASFASNQQSESWYEFLSFTKSLQSKFWFDQWTQTPNI